MGSISMTCYGVDVDIDLEALKADGAAGLPSGVPADQSNI